MPTYNNNYKKNLELYWQQFYTEYHIPDGYQVHHIRPKCTFADNNDPRIHHPRNLIALHPDDHVSIHLNRGDKWVSGAALLTVSGRKMSDETKQKISTAKKGIASCRPGYKHSAETKQKIGSANTGNQHSNATKSKLSEINKGKKLSKETKKKMSDSGKGRVSGRKGKTNSAEHNAKISATAAKKRLNKKLGEASCLV